MFSRSSRTSSTPVLEAPSISKTSIPWPAVISVQEGHSLQGWWREALFAVEGLGQDAGGGGLADSAGAGEEEGVMDPAGSDGICQRLADMLLPDQVLESSGAAIFGPVPDTTWAASISVNERGLRGRKCERNCRHK